MTVQDLPNLWREKAKTFLSFDEATFKYCADELERALEEGAAKHRAEMAAKIAETAQAMLLNGFDRAEIIRLLGTAAFPGEPT